MSAPEPRSRFWDFNIGHVIMLLAMFGSLQYWGGGLVAKITTMQSDIDRNKLDIVEERAARAEAATQAAAQAREASADALQWRNEIDTKLEGLIDTWSGWTSRSTTFNRRPSRPFRRLKCRRGSSRGTAADHSKKDSL
ncbi:MAG: hypothetical protein WDN04_13685 [Rhodospirillales bacterium]